MGQQTLEYCNFIAKNLWQIAPVPLLPIPKALSKKIFLAKQKYNIQGLLFP